MSYQSVLKLTEERDRARREAMNLKARLEDLQQDHEIAERARLFTPLDWTEIIGALQAYSSAQDRVDRVTKFSYLCLGHTLVEAKT